MIKNILLIAFIITFQINAQTKPIEEFNFNGNRSNTENSNSFLGISKFVADRVGNANNAIRIVNSPMEITIPNLPVSNKARSVSVWVKYNDISIPNYIWGYGSSFNAQYFGLVQQSTLTAKSDLNLASWGPANDAIVTTTIAINTWYNYTVTFDGLTSKIYRNGTLIRSSITPRKLTSGNVFTIGKMGTSVSINADIDDLKIYDVALSPEEVLNVYEYSSVLAPNDVVEKIASITTVNKIADVKTGSSTKTTATKQEIILATPVETVVVKSSEIFSTQGQKVISSNKNDIDISALPEGTYLLKVTNLNQNENAKKLTVK
ncbi:MULTISPECIES: LamG domain-containing protein [Flavobacterium]|uniref:LamG domain-containing protein n=1 Tax=Flavobacterium TaxID=237 RepID=UPI0022AC681A|nr:MULTISPECIES: LamG domain-containing protein [Flavobacterium]